MREIDISYEGLEAKSRKAFHDYITQTKRSINTISDGDEMVIDYNHSDKDNQTKINTISDGDEMVNDDHRIFNVTESQTQIDHRAYLDKINKFRDMLKSSHCISKGELKCEMCLPHYTYANNQIAIHSIYTHICYYHLQRICAQCGLTFNCTQNLMSHLRKSRCLLLVDVLEHEFLQSLLSIRN